jgi:hypothetical protein
MDNTVRKLVCLVEGDIKPFQVTLTAPTRRISTTTGEVLDIFPEQVDKECIYIIMQLPPAGEWEWLVASNIFDSP